MIRDVARNKLLYVYLRLNYCRHSLRLQERVSFEGTVNSRDCPGDYQWEQMHVKTAAHRHISAVPLSCRSSCQLNISAREKHKLSFVSTIPVLKVPRMSGHGESGTVCSAAPFETIIKIAGKY